MPSTETPGESSADVGIVRPYCLRCYLPLERAGEAVQTCPRCGHRNLQVDQQLYWTQERRLRELEELAKAVVVLLTAGTSAAILFGVRSSMHLGMGQGFVVGLPILLGALLWDTASKITRRSTYFRPGLVWSLILGILGLAVTAMGLVGLFSARSDALPIALAFLFCGLPLLVLAVSARPLARRFERWQARRIQRSQVPQHACGSPVR